MTTAAPSVKVHRFEAAGLGQAPFRVLGSYRAVFQAVPGDPSCPIQPGSSCDYCGTGISQVIRVGSADGREFKVGSECALKTGDAGLRVQLAPLLRELEREKRDARDAAKRAELEALLADPANRAKLEAVPHARGFKDRATGRPLTLLDEYEWLVSRCGAAGRARTLKALKARLAELA